MSVSSEQSDRGEEHVATTILRAVDPAPRRSTGAALRRIAYAGALLLTFLATAEIAARLEGALASGESLIAEPDIDANLKMRDSDGTRGRPGGSYMNCQLNEFGFRGCRMDMLPSPGTLRVMVLGSSESFGSTESAGMEFPALMDRCLRQRGSIEVVNASIIGMTPRSMLPYWRNWARQFRPHVVIIYPNAFFYLNMAAARETSTTRVTALPSEGRRPVGSRLLFRLHRTLHYPDWIQTWRDRRMLVKVEAEHPSDWVFQTVPQDRLEAFRKDMIELVDLIREDGAQPFLVTHPISAASVDHPADLFQLRHMRTICPRASEELFLSFSAAANQVVAEVGRDRDTVVIDLARYMTGQRELFSDLVHFNNLGAARAAERMSAAIEPHLDQLVHQITPDRVP